MSRGDAGSVLRGRKVKIGDKVTAAYKVKGDKIKMTKGFVSEISKNGYVKLQDCRRWLEVVQTLPSVEEHGDSKRRISKEIIIKGASAKIGDKVKIYAGRSKQLRRIVIKEKENREVCTFKTYKKYVYSYLT